MQITRIYYNSILQKVLNILLFKSIYLFHPLEILGWCRSTIYWIVHSFLLIWNATSVILSSATLSSNSRLSVRIQWSLWSIIWRIPHVLNTTAYNSLDICYYEFSSSTFILLQHFFDPLVLCTHFRISLLMLGNPLLDFYGNCITFID